MPLPSGTSISAADINSYLSRSSGSQVSWNTTVRTLSNSNSPNLGDARGQSARFAQYSSGEVANYLSSYYSSSLYASRSAAFNIPNSQCRVIVDSLPAGNYSSFSHAVMITVVNTNYDAVRRWVWPGAALPWTITFYSPNAGGHTVTPYPSYTKKFAMLDDGKLVIMFPGTQWTGATNGNHGLHFIVLQFNPANGDITYCKQFKTDLANIANGWANNNTDATNYLYLNNYHTNNTAKMRSFGNTFAFAVYSNDYTYNLQKNAVVKATISSDGNSLDMQYCQVAAGDYSINTGGNTNEYAQLDAILQSDGSVMVIKPVSQTNSSYSVMACKLGNSGGYTAYNRYKGPPANCRVQTSGVPDFYYSWSIGSYDYDSNYLHLTDSQGYYYIVKYYYDYLEGYRLSGYPYSDKFGTGTVTSLVFHKINSSNNSSVCKFLFGGDNYSYGYTVSSKGGTYSYIAPYLLMSRESVRAIESDSSGNTYIVLKTYAVEQGMTRTSTATSAYSLSAPQVHTSIYTFLKIDTSGSVVWSKVLDLGAKLSARNYCQDSPISDINGPLYGGDYWTILLREEIGVVEAYVTAPVRNIATTGIWELLNFQRNTRSVHLLMSTGDSYTYSSGSSAIREINISNDITSDNTYSVTTSGGTTKNLTIRPLYKTSWNTSADNTVSNTSVFSGSSTWTTIPTISAMTNSLSSLFSENNAYYSLGNTFNKVAEQ